MRIMEEIRKVSVSDMLSARDARVERQRRLLEKHRLPLVSFSMNIPGEVKRDAAIRRAFFEGRRHIEAALGEAVAESVETDAFTGCECVYAVCGDAAEIKARMRAIEEADELGRLFDIDVLGADGEKLSRAEGEGRRCLICGGDARCCGRARSHTAAELNRRAHDIIRTHFEEAYALRVGEAARRALLFEVEATPKPGLVDRENSGAHTDMDISHFRRSAEALEGYFADCVRIGMKTRGASYEEVFEPLRCVGIEAEAAMCAATGGVNTHKGAIFILGLLACAAGRAGEGAGREAVFEISAGLGAIPLAELERMKIEDARTGGERQYLQYGLTGARGEAAQGFPHVRNVVLPALKEARDRGEDENAAALYALVRLMAVVEDSNVLRRAGREGIEHMHMCAQELLGRGVGEEALRRMNADFIRRNISPGGCADLLAAARFIELIEVPEED